MSKRQEVAIRMMQDRMAAIDRQMAACQRHCQTWVIDGQIDLDRGAQQIASQAARYEALREQRALASDALDMMGAMVDGGTAY